MKVLAHLLVALLVVAMGACQNEPTAEAPPSMLYGEDICDECNMIISEARFAAAYVTSNGIQKRFDDVGCMLIYHNDNNDDVANFWIQDYHGDGWVNANKAYFILSTDLVTPMAHGIVAFRNASSAESLASSLNTTVIDFEQLIRTKLTGHHGRSENPAIDTPTIVIH